MTHNTTGQPDLTDHQAAVLEAITASVTSKGYPPTVQEIADAVGLAKATVMHHLIALERAGRIRRDPGKPRALTIVETRS